MFVNLTKLKSFSPNMVSAFFQQIQIIKSQAPTFTLSDQIPNRSANCQDKSFAQMSSEFFKSFTDFLHC